MGRSTHRDRRESIERKAAAVHDVHGLVVCTHALIGESALTTAAAGRAGGGEGGEGGGSGERGAATAGRPLLTVARSPGARCPNRPGEADCRLSRRCTCGGRGVSATGWAAPKAFSIQRGDGNGQTHRLPAAPPARQTDLRRQRRQT